MAYGRAFPQAILCDGHTHSRAARQPPPSLAGIGEPARPIVGDAQWKESSQAAFWPFPLLPDTVPQTAPYPRVEFFQFLKARGVPEVIHPASKFSGSLLNMKCIFAWGSRCAHSGHTQRMCENASHASARSHTHPLPTRIYGIKYRDFENLATWKGNAIKCAV